MFPHTMVPFLQGQQAARAPNKDRLAMIALELSVTRELGSWIVDGVALPISPTTTPKWVVSVICCFRELTSPDSGCLFTGNQRIIAPADALISAVVRRARKTTDSPGGNPSGFSEDPPASS